MQWFSKRGPRYTMFREKLNTQLKIVGKEKLIQCKIQVDY